MGNYYVRAPRAVGTGTGLAEWAPNTAYVVGDRVVCRNTYGSSISARRRYVYECTTGGTSHATTEPTWPTSGTVNDNGVIWTTRSPTTWANATCRLQYCFGLQSAGDMISAGDTVWIENTYDDNWNNATYPFFQFGLLSGLYNGGIATTRLIVTADVTNEPPQSQTTGAKQRALSYVGFAWDSLYIYGLEIQAGYGASSGTPYIETIRASNTDNPTNTALESCVLKLAYAVTGCYVYLGENTVSRVPGSVRLLNTTIELSHAGQQILLGSGSVQWVGGALTGTAPTYAFAFPTRSPGSYLVCGVDLSGVTGTLVDPTNAQAEQMVISRCKLNSTVTEWRSAVYPSRPGTTLVVELCDPTGGNKNYKLSTRQYDGSLTDNITYVRSGGASDGVTPVSWKIETNADASFVHAFETPWMATWIDSVGQALNFTVEALHDNASPLLDSELWLEALCLTNSGAPLAELKNDYATWPLSASAQNSSSVEWYTTGMANPHKQKMTVTATPQLKGLVTARVRMSKPSYTVYVDPKIVVE